MPRTRARPRNTSVSNQSLDRWLPKWAFRRSILRSTREPRLGRRRSADQVAVPLGDLVFEDEVVAEGIRSQPADFPMILMRIVPPMRQDQVRLDLRLDLLQILLIPRLAAERRHPGTSSLRHWRSRLGRGNRPPSRELPLRALSGGAQHAPDHVELDAARQRSNRKPPAPISISSECAPRQRKRKAIAWAGDLERSS